MMNRRAKTITYSMIMAGIPLWRGVVYTKVMADPASLTRSISDAVSRAISETVYFFR